MKRLLCALLVTAMAPLAYGQAAAPADADAAKDAAASATASDKSALTTQTGSEGAKVKAILGERNCVRETGSLIVRHDKCVNATGQAYDETAMGRTGTYDTGTALERMSPQVQVRPAR